MKLLQSSKMTLPVLYFISDRSKIPDIPIGVPFIYGDENTEKYIIRIMEYEQLYLNALKTGFDFNFRKLLMEAGYDIESLYYSNPPYLEYSTDETKSEDSYGIDIDLTPSKDTSLFKKFMKDSAVYVDIRKLKELNVFPVWLDIVDDAVSENIHNFITFNPRMYNKRLGGFYGGVELSSPKKNLIIIDISGSIPKGVSSTALTLAKFQAETYYADLLITGSKSNLYPFEEIHTLDVTTLYAENGMDNDQFYFRELVTGSERHYKTAIVYGDNHSPCDAWNNEYSRGNSSISKRHGKEICKWKVDKLISFHTHGTDYTAGYADWFSPKETVKIDNWVKYIN